MTYKKGDPTTYIFDIDGTIADYEGDEFDYADAVPDENMIKILNKLHDMGHEIIIETGRGGNSGIDWKELTMMQLEEWGVKYDKLMFVHKPWEYIRVDDRGRSPEEFLNEVEI